MHPSTSLISHSSSVAIDKKQEWESLIVCLLRHSVAREWAGCSSFSKASSYLINALLKPWQRDCATDGKGLPDLEYWNVWGFLCCLVEWWNAFQPPVAVLKYLLQTLSSSPDISTTGAGSISLFPWMRGDVQVRCSYQLCWHAQVD